MPKHRGLGLGLGLDPRFLTGHYGALDLQRQTSIEARNDKFLRKAMEEDERQKR